MDKYLFNLTNQFAGKWTCLDGLGIFFAKYSEYILVLILISFLALNFKKYWKMVFLAFGSAIVARFIVGSFIRFLWFRPRPFVNNQVNLLLPGYNANEASFPSGHALFYFALSTIVFCFNKKLGIFFYAFSFLIVLSRVFVGIHWPSDILAGAVIGVFIGWLVCRLTTNFRSIK